MTSLDVIWRHSTRYSKPDQELFTTFWCMFWPSLVVIEPFFTKLWLPTCVPFLRHFFADRACVSSKTRLITYILKTPTSAKKWRHQNFFDVNLSERDVSDYIPSFSSLAPIFSTLWPFSVGRAVLPCPGRNQYTQNPGWNRVNERQIHFTYNCIPYKKTKSFSKQSATRNKSTSFLSTTSFSYINQSLTR